MSEFSLVAKQIDREGVGFNILAPGADGFRLEVRHHEALAGAGWFKDYVGTFAHPYLGGLDAGERYIARLLVDGAEVAVCEFRTPGADESQREMAIETFEVQSFGDERDGPYHLAAHCRHLAGKISEEGFTITAGDLRDVADALERRVEPPAPVQPDEAGAAPGREENDAKP